MFKFHEIYFPEREYRRDAPHRPPEVELEECFPTANRIYSKTYHRDFKEELVCCICLAKYADNDLLRELPCTHFFHIECVDKWLKINASCPLCKYEIGSSSEISSTEDSNQQQA